MYAMRVCHFSGSWWELILLFLYGWLFSCLTIDFFSKYRRYTAWELLSLEILDKCNKNSLYCLFWRREAGVLIRNLDITSGEVRVNLNEDLLLEEKSLADTSPDLPQEFIQANNEPESESDEKQQGKKTTAVFKYSSIIPEKVYPLLNVLL